MTSPSPLERLAGPGNVLAKEPPDAKEFAGLVRSGLARLKDAENEANSLDSRFDLAYSAAHALCLAALRHHGFRPSKRYIVFQVLPDTLGLGPEVWRVLSKCHDMRNRTEYEGVLDVDDRLVSDLIGACRKVADKVSSCRRFRRSRSKPNMAKRKSQRGNPKSTHLSVFRILHLTDHQKSRAVARPAAFELLVPQRRRADRGRRRGGRGSRWRPARPRAAAATRPISVNGSRGLTPTSSDSITADSSEGEADSGDQPSDHRRRAGPQNEARRHRDAARRALFGCRFHERAG